MRADIFLVEKRYAASRQKAKSMIEEGLVYVDGVKLIKASQNVADGSTAQIRGDVMPYVSRGGLKLKGAIDVFGLDISGMVCIDIGASTGGFSDCLLQHGAKKVYAVDCGHGQLDKKIACDARVVSIEGFNARELCYDTIGEKADIIVMDVSFISQTLIHPVLTTVLKNGGSYITLIKPQFEAGRSNVGKNGIVKNEKARISALEKVIGSAESCGFKLCKYVTSPITGGDGNIEYLALFTYKEN